MHESGILLHITSLLSPCGIGTMGKEAFEFVDFLEKSASGIGSFYRCSSQALKTLPINFVCNHYLIDLEQLIEENLLTGTEV